LNVWEKSHELTLDVYRVTTRFPKEEIYGLTSQMRRSSASISANIAEGCGRDTDADFARFLQMAMGSASELEYHLLLARDLGVLKESTHSDLSIKTVTVKKLLTKLIQKLKRDARPPQADR